MEKYLNDFESARKAASGAGGVVAVMKAKYRLVAGEVARLFRESRNG